MINIVIFALNRVLIVKNFNITKNEYLTHNHGVTVAYHIKQNGKI